MGNRCGGAHCDDGPNAAEPVSTSPADGVQVVAVVCHDASGGRIACLPDEKGWEAVAVALAETKGLLLDLWQADD
jgi:hypothetical protein